MSAAWGDNISIRRRSRAACCWMDIAAVLHPPPPLALYAPPTFLLPLLLLLLAHRGCERFQGVSTCIKSLNHKRSHVCRRMTRPDTTYTLERGGLAVHTRPAAAQREAVQLSCGTCTCVGCGRPVALVRVPLRAGIAGHHQHFPLDTDHPRLRVLESGVGAVGEGTGCAGFFARLPLVLREQQ